MDDVAAFAIAALANIHLDHTTLQTPLKITSLPNDILSSIRLLLVEDDFFGIQRPCKSFQFVCRQFRNLELSLPSLWTTVLDTMSSDRIELQILRSGNLGLSVFITSDHAEQRCRCAQHKTIVRYNDRWSRARIIAVGNNRLHPLDHLCFKAFEGTSFPSLERLQTGRVAPAAFAIISTWSIPRLRHAKCRSIVDLLRVPFLNPLATLEIFEIYEMVNLYTYARFLTTPAASQLTFIKSKFFSSECEHSLNENKLPRLDLVTVKEFSLEIYCSGGNEQTILQLFKHFRLPNVETVTIDISHEALQRDSFIKWCRSLKNPSLQTVTLVLAGGDRYVADEVRALVQTKLLTALKGDFDCSEDRGSSGNTTTGHANRLLID